MNAPVTPEQVAEWMITELERVNFLYQETIAYQIASQFGNELTYYNENGNLAIDAAVLKAFRDLTGDAVVWSRGERMWRKRAAYDRPGRQQD